MTLWIRKRRRGDHWRNVSIVLPDIRLPDELTNEWFFELGVRYGLIGKNEEVARAWIVPTDGD